MVKFNPECMDYFYQRDIDRDYPCNGHDRYTDSRRPCPLNTDNEYIRDRGIFENCEHIRGSGLIHPSLIFNVT